MTEKPVRVLIVDDDEDDYFLTRGMLTQVEHGFYAVDWADSYEAGLEQIERNEHDVYLVDYRLGRENGLQLLRQAKATGCNAPMILLTGQGDHEVDAQATSIGADGYLDKGRLGSTDLDRSIRYALRRHDVEQQRRDLDAHIREIQRVESLGVMAAGVAHDFNNLLAGIVGYADLALSELNSDSPARELVEGIRRTARSATELTGQLLTYTGRNSPMKQRLNLSRQVDEMRSLLSAVVSRNTSLSFDLAPDLDEVDAAPGQIGQLIMNLVTNASEALGGRPGNIKVSTTLRICDRAYLAGAIVVGDVRRGQYACLVVEDTGCGMDAETKSRMFDPFFTTKFTGRGLGLASVLGIVRNHAGVICVDSEPGRGTRFEVLLPCAESGPESTSPAPKFSESTDSSVEVRNGEATAGDATERRAGQAPPASKQSRGHTELRWLKRGATILIVDDDRVVREVIGLSLQRMGYRVLKAGDGQEAVEVFRQHAADVAGVVLDVTMPIVDGKQALAAILALRTDVPVVLCSGFGEESVTDQTAAGANVRFIQKPYLLRDLVSMLDDMLRPQRA